MNTPILTLVDDLIHTFAHPYCGNTTCTCNTPLRDAHTEAVAQVRSIERAMSLQEAREILRITARRLGDSYTATYDSETESLQLICAGSDIRLILTLEACYQLSDFLNAMLPMHKNLDSYLQWRLNAMLALCQNHTSKGQAESEAQRAWQPFGPDTTPESFQFLGSHYRGFPVIKVCSTCKSAFQTGDFTVRFSYK